MVVAAAAGIDAITRRGCGEACRAGAPGNLPVMSDALIELSSRLRDTAARLRSGQLEADAALVLVEECARLATEASAEVDTRSRAALEPLPDLPGQLPLTAA